MSGIIILVGGTGCGKTTYGRKMLQPVNKKAVVVYDVNNEYEGYPNRYTPLTTDIDTFIDVIFKCKNAVILMEDMTGFLSNRGRSSKMVQVMQGRRHTFNTIIMLYHSMTAIPKYVMDLATVLVIFKTNDDELNINKKFSKKIITEAWKDVQEKAANNPFYSNIGKGLPPPKNTVPDYRMVSLY